MKTLKWIAAAAVLAFAADAANSASREIYPDPAQARPEIAAALKTAAATHKRVLIDFGGNWCGDCRVLDIYFHNETNRPILDANFVLVHVNVGHFAENVDLAERYRAPLKRGVPELAVLSERGELLYSTQTAEFEKMQEVESSAVTQFLVKWKPTKPGCSAVMVSC